MQDVSPSNVKLLEVHTREVLYNTGMGRDFLKTPPWKNQRKLKQSRSGMQENKKKKTSTHHIKGNSNSKKKPRNRENKCLQMVHLEEG